jgi:glutathione S-transferase
MLPSLSVYGDLRLSESGAIVHYLALKSEKLTPKDPVSQARVTSWMFAALNSVEPFVQQWQLDVYFAKEAWSKPRLLEYRKRCEARPAFRKALTDHTASFDDSLGPTEMPRSS